MPRSSRLRRVMRTAGLMAICAVAGGALFNFGDNKFWGTLQLHRAIEGSAHGGVGPGVSPKTALSVGLKVDADALPAAVRQAIAAGQVNLDDPATTLALL